MITVDSSKLREMEQVLEQYPKKAPLAIMRALNRTADNIKTNASRKVREEYTVKAKDINTTFRINKATKGVLAASVVSQSGSIGLDKFKVSPLQPRHNKPPKYLKVQVKKSGGVKQLVRAFVASVSGNKVFERDKGASAKKGKNGIWTTLPINRLFGPPVPQMIGNKAVIESIESEAVKTYEARLEHEIKRIMEGSG